MRTKTHRKSNLHSTMFLLIRWNLKLQPVAIIHLHSTMFLLIRNLSLISFAFLLFTFHNVSINSRVLASVEVVLWYLHSTMFLLILTLVTVTVGFPTIFTFHNVSINSRYLIFLIFPTFSLLFLSTLDSICVFPLYSHLKIIIYLLFMPLSMSPVFYFIEHRQFYNFIFLTAYAISFNFLNVYSYFSTYQQTHCNIIKLQLRIIFFILNRLWT